MPTPYTANESISGLQLEVGHKVAIQGVEYVVTGFISGVNMSAARVHDGKKFKLRRQGRYMFAGEMSTEQFKDEVPDINMGDIVILSGKKFDGLVGVVGTIADKTVTIAIPGHVSVRAGKVGLKKGTIEDLAEFLPVAAAKLAMAARQ